MFLGRWHNEGQLMPHQIWHLRSSGHYNFSQWLQSILLRGIMGEVNLVSIHPTQQCCQVSPFCSTKRGGGLPRSLCLGPLSPGADPALLDPTSPSQNYSFQCSSWRRNDDQISLSLALIIMWSYCRKNFQAFKHFLMNSSDSEKWKNNNKIK